MEIGKKLDTDKDLEFLNSGDLIHASNIVINNKNASIQNENAIEKYTKLEDETEEIVGTIACSDEFILFTNKNNIIRHNEKTKENVYVQTNWKWGGGEVFGSYTYNVNNELIIAISERNTKNKVSFKTINLNEPNYEKEGSEDKYTLNPPIPQYNLIGYDIITGPNMIYNGVYVFFIRFFVNDDDYTHWFKVGYPIPIYNKEKTKNFEDSWYRGAWNEEVNTTNIVLGDSYVDDTEKVSHTIQLFLNIYDNTQTYKYYQIGYIITTTKNEIKTYVEPANPISNSVCEITNTQDNKYTISLDDITSTFFNLYNINTLCNYNNRIYIADYIEENNNSVISKINTSEIEVTFSQKDSILSGNSEDATTRNINIDSNEEIITNSVVSKFNINDSENKEITPGNYIIDLTFITKSLETSGIENKDKCIIYTKYEDVYYSEIKKTYVVIIPLFDMFSSIFNRDKPSLYNPYNYSRINIAADNICYLYYNNNTNNYVIEMASSNKHFNNKHTTIKTEIKSTFEFVDFELNSIHKTSNNILDVNGDFNILFPFDKLGMHNNYNTNILNNITNYELTYKENDVLVTKVIESASLYKAIEREVIWSTNNRYSISTNTDKIINCYGFVKSHIGEKESDEVQIENLYNINIIYFDVNKYIRHYYNLNDNDIIKYKIYSIDSPDKYSFKNYNLNAMLAYDLFNKELLIYGIRDRLYSSEVESYIIINSIFSPYFTINDSNEIHNISEILSININNIININDTLETIKEKCFNKYIWNNENRPVTNKDFEFDKLYKLFLINAVNGINNKQQYKNLKVYKVGLNRTKLSNNIIGVDIDYCLLIPYIDYLNNRNVAGNPNYKDYWTFEQYDKTPSNKYIRTGYLKNVYICFTKNNIYEIEDINSKENVICNKAKLIYINDDNNLLDVEILFEYNNIESIYELRNNYFKIFDENKIEKGYENAYIAFMAYPNEIVDNDKVLIKTSTKVPLKKWATSDNVYNFFIHYVYNNGNYTDGIRISNNSKYEKRICLGTKYGVLTYYDCDDNTTIDDVKSYFNSQSIVQTEDSDEIVNLFISGEVQNTFVCNISPMDYSNVTLYKNSKGEKMFRVKGISVYGKDTDIGYGTFKFDNIPMYPEFVGYFISYEKPESMFVGRAIISHSTIVDYTLSLDNVYTSEFLNVYYHDFDITNNINFNYIKIGDIYDYAMASGSAVFGFDYLRAFDYNYYDRAYNKLYPIKNKKLYAPKSDNKHGTGCIEIELYTKVAALPFVEVLNERKSHRYKRFALLYNIHNNLYINTNKQLVSLGYISYAKYKEGKTYSYGYKDINYNYDMYLYNKELSLSSGNKVYNYPLYCFNATGAFMFIDGNPYPVRRDNTQLYPYPVEAWNDGKSFSHIGRIGFNFVSRVLYHARNIKEESLVRAFTYVYTHGGRVQTYNNVNTNITNTNNMFKISSAYLDYSDKLLTNFNKDNYFNFIEQYKKTIRRSDVISDESVENKWKIFRPEQYKLIAENKGNIINLVGIGSYLIAHCEHSMFIFNRDSSMKTEDKNVQLVIPDTFDIEYVEMFTSTKGYAGIQKTNQYICSNYGYIFYDSDARKLYRYDENSLTEITTGFKHLFDKGIDDINFVIDESNERFIALGYITENNKKIKFTISYNFNSKYWISTHSYWYNKSFNTKNNVYFIDNSNNQINSFNKIKYNNYTDLILDEDNIYKEEHLKIEDSENILSYSFIDVLFTKDNTDKVLNYITYIINEDSVAEYSGDKLLIYTNCCYSDYIDISKPRKKITDHKNPYYRYGIWTMNWFRNKIRDIKTNMPIYRHTGKMNNDIIFEVRKGLDNSLIVGKYFVVRLIFKNKDKVINVNDIQCY